MLDQQYVYHSSKNKGLKVIKPNKSTHNQNWVYATKNVVLSTLFLGDNFDFICQIGGAVELPFIYERFEGALKHAYENKSGVIYKLSSETFLEGRTQWKAEVVSEKAANVVEEIQVENVFETIKKYAEENKLDVYYYPNVPEGEPTGKSDIIERAVSWTRDYGDEYIDLIEQYHPDILDKVVTQLKNDRYKPSTSKWKIMFK